MVGFLFFGYGVDPVVNFGIVAKPPAQSVIPKSTTGLTKKPEGIYCLVRYSWLCTSQRKHQAKQNPRSKRRDPMRHRHTSTTLTLWTTDQTTDESPTGRTARHADLYNNYAAGTNTNR